MIDLEYYIKKLQDLEPRGEWKDVYSHYIEKLVQSIASSKFLRRKDYIEELERYHHVLIDLPFSPDDEERLIFRRNQKHIIDLLFLIRKETKKIAVVQGKPTEASKLVITTLETLSLDFIVLDLDSEETKNISLYIEKTKACEFAIIILSAEEAARSLTGEGSVVNHIHQHVVFQIGYFLSQVGRKNIITINNNLITIELPIDMSTFTNITVNTSGAWEKELIEQLANNGIYLEKELINKL